MSVLVAAPGPSLLLRSNSSSLVQRLTTTNATTKHQNGNGHSPASPVAPLTIWKYCPWCGKQFSDDKEEHCQTCDRLRGKSEVSPKPSHFHHFVPISLAIVTTSFCDLYDFSLLYL
jgi:hypothetical protein